MAVAGAGGFVGSLVVEELTARGAVVIPIPRSVLDRSATQIASFLAHVDVVVNAAGMATPSARRSSELTRANATLPATIAQACQIAGVARLVHVSSAAVQGSMTPLDESASTKPLSPYAKSKAAAEEVLSTMVDGRLEIVIYRATSVQGRDQRSTALLRRLARLPVIPMVDNGTVPIPVSLDRVTAGAIAHVAVVEEYPGILVLHPWEGQTTRSFLEALGWRGRALPLPRRAIAPVVRVALGPASHVPALYSKLRLIELMLMGQAQVATHVSESGYQLPKDIMTRYRELRSGGS